MKDVATSLRNRWERNCMLNEISQHKLVLKGPVVRLHIQYNLVFCILSILLVTQHVKFDLKYIVYGEILRMDVFV